MKGWKRMGLELYVGILQELRELGENEGVGRYQQQFERINSFLQEKKLPTHAEPEVLESGKAWTAQMWGYSGIHELRRVAVYLLAGKELPPPATDQASNDPLLAAYYSERQHQTRTPPEMMDKSHPTPWAFKHLLLHSDAEGFYLPLNFNFVLFAPQSFEIAGGGMIGSSLKLAQEIVALGKALQLPRDLDHDADEIIDAAEAGGNADDPVAWKRLPVAAHACLALAKGVVMSYKHKAALVFT